MTKRYVLSREDLQNLIHESITFFSNQAQKTMEAGKIFMFSDRVRCIDEFLDKCLREYPVDKALDELDSALSSYAGRSIDDIKNDHRKTTKDYSSKMEKIKKYQKDMLGE
jgi:hypothetical protein